MDNVSCSEIDCCLCLNTVFNQPAGCLTQIALCPNQTENNKHALCWVCVFKLHVWDTKNEVWTFPCPLCRHKCAFLGETIEPTGEIGKWGECEACLHPMDEFGPRMCSVIDNKLCMECALKVDSEEHPMTRPPTFVQGYECSRSLKLVGSHEVSVGSNTEIKEDLTDDMFGMIFARTVADTHRHFEYRAYVRYLSEPNPEYPTGNNETMEEVD